MDEERLQSSILTLRRRSTLVIIALSAVMLARAGDIAVRVWSLDLIAQIPPYGADPDLMERLESADAMVNGINVAVLITLVVTAFTFSWWTHRLVFASRELGVTLPLTPAQAVWAFIIPIVSLSRPFQLFNAAHKALEPANVALPALRVDPSAQDDYRSTRFIETAPMQKLPRALIGVWWGAFLVMCFASRILNVAGGKAKTIAAVTDAYHGSMFLSVVAIVAAALAITVVRGLTARVLERFRRIRASTPEELAAQGIELPR